MGGGGHAKVLIGVLKKVGYAVRGYTDMRDRGPILGIPYLGEDSALAGLVGACSRSIVGVGKIDASPLRLVLQDQFGALGFEFPAVLSPQAVINEEVSLGAGTAVFDGAVIGSGSRIGRACILNTGSIVEHDCRIGENVHVAPGAILSGGVSLGDHCMVGAGATIIQSISVCANCLIGAGATVTKDLASPGVYAGNPARLIV